MLECEEVSINPPAPDNVSARRRKRHLTEARQHRSGQQNRRTDLGTESWIQRLRLESATVQPHQVGTDPLGAGPQIHQEGEHRFDITDTRDVVQIDWTIRQDRRSKDRERGVFVAGGADRSTQWTATSDQKSWRHGQT
jgi:hypothetical protein